MTIQLAIDFSEPLSRKRDPQTSHDAAERAQEFAASHAGICYGVISDVGTRGCTARDIAEYSRLSFVQANRRLSAMCEQGLIVRRPKPDARHERDFVSRAGAAVWWVAK